MKRQTERERQRKKDRKKEREHSMHGHYMEKERQTLDRDKGKVKS